MIGKVDRSVVRNVAYARENVKNMERHNERRNQNYYNESVDTEIRWTKRCKDPALVGKVKEVVKKVSNSKKWKSERVRGEDGKKRLLYSYSLLQDRYFSHMRKAGFRDFERGERGSTAEHLEVLDYKIKKDRDAVTALNRSIEKKRTAVTVLDEAISGRKQTADGSFV